ncbi:MAG: DUF2252 domain-containing protein [Lautropia sp.]|nr:DUF2252 domain-containing protein [Lautropia sp.]
MLPHQNLPAATDAAALRVRGKQLRTACSRSSHAELNLPLGRDALGIIDATHVGRVPELIGTRTYRMSQSAFAYYRATADVMTADLAAGPRTDIRLVVCGDAHISNFGLYASPERRLLFDLNDFDEAAEGPWEWDIKRMCVSIVLVLREKGCSERVQARAVRHAVLSYQKALAELVEQSVLARYYASVDAAWLLKATQDAHLARSMKKARRNTSQRVLEKITTCRDGQGLAIADNPPLLMHDRSLQPDELVQMFDHYLATLAADRALLMSQYRVLDIARRVVGVGSVGTRCGIALLQDPGGHALFMQYKQANSSVIVRWGGLGDTPGAIGMGDSGPLCDVPAAAADAAPGAVASASATGGQASRGRTRQPRSPSMAASTGTTARAGARSRRGQRAAPEALRHDGHNGRRVVARQQVLQAVSDPLLGWNTGADDGHDYYWRQFRDMKGSIDLPFLSPGQVEQYGSLCARLLARAHAQSPTATAVAGYLGRSSRFAEAVATWSLAYADVVEQDFLHFLEALSGGRYPFTPEEETR